MTVQYTHLSYEEYKELQSQMEEFKETTHRTEGGFYHKSIRLRINADFVMEFHGPLVGGYGHPDEAVAKKELEEDKVAVIAILKEQGGSWTKFIPGEDGTVHECHALLYENGAVWDLANGWRTERISKDRIKSILHD